MSVPTTTDEQPKSRKALIIAAAVVVFCCLCSLCLALFWYLYSSGDQLFRLAARQAVDELLRSARAASGPFAPTEEGDATRA